MGSEVASMARKLMGSIAHGLYAADGGRIRYAFNNVPRAERKRVSHLGAIGARAGGSTGRDPGNATYAVVFKVLQRYGSPHGYMQWSTLNEISMGDLLEYALAMSFEGHVEWDALRDRIEEAVGHVEELWEKLPFHGCWSSDSFMTVLARYA